MTVIPPHTMKLFSALLLTCVLFVVSVYCAKQNIGMWHLLSRKRYLEMGWNPTLTPISLLVFLCE